MERRDTEFKDLQAAVADARLLLEKGCEAAGEWDLAQVCGHCSYAINSSIDGFDSSPPFFIKLLAKIAGMKKKIYRTRALKSGLPAPSVSIPAPANGDRDTETKAVEEFSAAVNRITQYSASLQPHPVFGQISRDEWLEFHTIHAMHHLSFLVPVGTVEAAA